MQGCFLRSPLLRATSNIEIRWHKIHNNRDPNTHSYTLRRSFSRLFSSCRRCIRWICVRGGALSLSWRFCYPVIKKTQQRKQSGGGRGVDFSVCISRRAEHERHQLQTPAADSTAVAVLYIHSALLLGINAYMTYVCVRLCMRRL
jgi:hypothetical protein